MKLKDIKDPFLKEEIAQFIIVMQDWEKGKSIEPDAVDYIRMRMDLLLSQLNSKKA